MKLLDIEKAVMKQLPKKKYHEPGKGDLSNRPDVKKDRYLDLGMVIICGLANYYISDPKETILAHYDITSKSYNTNVNSFERHIKRVSQIIECYGATDYLSFAEIFWDKHNELSAGDKMKSGILLSHVLSSKREFSRFIADNPIFDDEDYLSFFIHNKAKLAKNYLAITHSLHRRQQYVDHLAGTF